MSSDGTRSFYKYDLGQLFTTLLTRFMGNLKITDQLSMANFIYS